VSSFLCLLTFVLMCLGLIVSVYFGRTAIFVYTVGCILVSNITVLKQVEFLSLTTSLGIFIFSVTYLSNDIVTEYWGREDAIRLVVCNLAAQVAFMGYSWLSIITPPAPTDDASAAIIKLFTVTPRITVAAIVSAVGGFICVWLFSLMKKRFRRGVTALLLRNWISTATGNGVNSMMFFAIAFYGILPNDVLGQIMVSAIVVKATLGILDFPFIWLARIVKNSNPHNKTSEPDWATA
jgi:queuosine precursor transporter